MSEIIRRYGPSSFVRHPAELIASPDDVAAARFQPQGKVCQPAVEFYRLKRTEKIMMRMDNQQWRWCSKEFKWVKSRTSVFTLLINGQAEKFL